MQRLSVFLLTLMVMSGTALASEYCADMSGTWSDASSNAYHLLQDARGVITGTITGNCNGSSPVTYTISNSEALGNGRFQLYAETSTNPKCYYGDGTPPGPLTVSINLNTVGCTQAWRNGDGYPTPPFMSQSCLVPNTSGAPGIVGEKTPPTSITWINGSARYVINLKGPIINGTQDNNYNWAGRTIQEGFSNQGPYPVSCRPPFGVSVAPPATISLLNYYSDDVGFPDPQDVGRARFNGPIPCGDTVTQTMSIDCPGGDVAYEVHSMTLEINGDGKTVSVSRNSYSPTPANQTYGWTAAVYSQIVNPNALVTFMYRLFY